MRLFRTIPILPVLLAIQCMPAACAELREGQSVPSGDRGSFFRVLPEAASGGTSLPDLEQNSDDDIARDFLWGKFLGIPAAGRPKVG